MGQDGEIAESNCPAHENWPRAVESRERSRHVDGCVSTLHGKARIPHKLAHTTSRSHHASPNYGKHYTAAEVTDIFAPSAESVEAVRSWLVAAGIPAGKISQSVNKQWLQFDAKTDEVEELLKTEYHVYEHLQSGRTNIACDE